MEQIENRMVTNDYIENINNYDSYLEYLAEQEDEYYEEEVFEKLGGNEK